MRTEIIHFTETPEIQHFAVEKVRKNDNAYGVTWGNLVLEYLKTAYLKEDTKAEVVSCGVTYKVLKRSGVTAFYDADGNTLFDVENGRLEKEYGLVMGGNTGDSPEHENIGGIRESAAADGDGARVKIDDPTAVEEAMPEELAVGEKEDSLGQKAQQSAVAKDVPTSVCKKTADGKEEPAKYSGIDGAVAKLQEELKGAKPKEFAEPVIGYLMDRCRESESLAADICQAHKTWKKCYRHIMENAKKKLNNVSGPVRSDTVFEWAEDYYHKDDKAEEEKKAKKETENKARRENSAAGRKDAKNSGAAKAKKTPVSKKEETPKEPSKRNGKEMEGQMDMFSMMGM